MEKAVILVDVQNIYYTTRQIHRSHFDYNHFWRQCTKGREVIKAIAYTTDRGDAKQRQFQNILRGIGFEVKLKPFIQRADGSAKGDWDVGITIDALEYAPQADVLVLASGDGDFAILLDKISRDLGVRTEVYGVRELTAQGLIAAASSYVPVEGELLLGEGTAPRAR
ncbi:MAG: NYN domain-containing protein [Gammaproteobacteria bacterium]